MRKLAIIGFLALSACAGGEGPVTKAHREYTACLDTRGVNGCTVEKAKFDAAVTYADTASRRAAAVNSAPPLVLRTYTPPPQQPIYTPRQQVNCNTYGGTTTCF